MLEELAGWLCSGLMVVLVLCYLTACIVPEYEKWRKRKRD